MAFKKGYIPWNKGKKTGLKPKNAFKKGNPIGLKTQFKKGNKVNLGHKHSVETINKMRNILKGRMVWNTGLGISAKLAYKTCMFNGKQVLEHHKIYCEAHNLTRIPREYVVHHKDGNQRNNLLLNLQLMTKSDHHKLHHAISKSMISQ